MMISLLPMQRAFGSVSFRISRTGVNTVTDGNLVIVCALFTFVQLLVMLQWVCTPPLVPFVHNRPEPAIMHTYIVVKVEESIDQVHSSFSHTGRRVVCAVYASCVKGLTLKSGLPGSEELISLFMCHHVWPRELCRLNLKNQYMPQFLFPSVTGWNIYCSLKVCCMVSSSN